MPSDIQNVLGAKSVPSPKTTPPNLGPQYQQLIDANPYRNQTYNETPWQSFLSALGFRTQADAWQENMSVQAAEYDASIAQKAYDESYNTPAMQAARMRAAGLNPDINGGQNISPGEAASLGQDPSTPMQSTGAEGTFSEFANLLMEGFSTAVGMVSTFQGIRANHLANTLSTFKNENEFQSFVRSMVPQLTPESPEDEVPTEEGAGFATTTWKERALQSAKMFARRNLPKKFRQKFIDSIYQYWNSAPAKPEAFKQWFAGIKSQKEYEGERAMFYSDDRRILRSIYSHLGEAREAIEKLRLQAEGQGYAADIKEGELREDVAEKTDPELAAGKLNAENKLAKETAEATDGKTIGVANTKAAQANSYEDEIRGILKKAIRDILRDAKDSNSLFGDAFISGVNILEFLKDFDFL